MNKFFIWIPFFGILFMLLKTYYPKWFKTNNSAFFFFMYYHIILTAIIFLHLIVFTDIVWLFK